MSRYLYARLLGPNICYVHGQTIKDPAPVLAACRYLVDLGFDRDRVLLAYRGEEIAMKLKIGDGARGYYRAQRMSWKALKATLRATAAASGAPNPPAPLPR